MSVHPTAIVSDSADVADDVSIGPFCIVNDNVSIGAQCNLQSHVVIHENVTIGKNNVFHQGCCIGDAPQDLSYDGSPTSVEIGDHNEFREYVTVHRGTPKDRKLTTIGSHCYFMAYSHIAHDCIVDDHVVLTNCAQLAGHTHMAEHSALSSFAGVHQFCRVGRFAFVGAIVIANKDILPFALAVAGDHNRTTIAGPNLTGLKRNGFSKEAMRTIRQAYKIIFHSKLNTSQALEKLKGELPDSPEVTELISFIESSKRGIAK